METVVIKYNAGNLRSVGYALQRLGVEPLVSDDPEIILNASRIIFPGVGEASSAMSYLKERGLDKVILGATQPFLGICLGMQLMCLHSAENDTACLGIFNEQVHPFVPINGEKVPQIGWNTISELKSPLFDSIPEESYCYFVHGFYAGIGEHTIASTNYCGNYSAALRKDNFYGVQFHPEKSSSIGQRIIENFLNIK